MKVPQVQTGAISNAIHPTNKDVGGAKSSFSALDIVKDTVHKVNDSLATATKMSEEHLVKGKHDMHEVMIALEHADLSFRYMSKVRDKVLEAYQEVMRMPV